MFNEGPISWPTSRILINLRGNVPGGDTKDVMRQRLPDSVLSTIQSHAITFADHKSTKARIRTVLEIHIAFRKVFGIFSKATPIILKVPSGLVHEEFIKELDNRLDHETTRGALLVDHPWCRYRIRYTLSPETVYPLSKEQWMNFDPQQQLNPHLQQNYVQHLQQHQPIMYTQYYEHPNQQQNPQINQQLSLQCHPQPAQSYPQPPPQYPQQHPPQNYQHPPPQYTTTNPTPASNQNPTSSENPASNQIPTQPLQSASHGQRAAYQSADYGFFTKEQYCHTTGILNSFIQAKPEDMLPILWKLIAYVELHFPKIQLPSSRPVGGVDTTSRRVLNNE